MFICWETSSVLFLVIGFFESPTRKPILSLHERFECGAGWGLERTLNKWVCQQPWRQRLPLSFFEMLDWQVGTCFHGVSPTFVPVSFGKGIFFSNFMSSYQPWGLMSQCLTNTPENCFLCDHLFLLHVPLMSLGKVFGGSSLVCQMPFAFVFKVQLTEQQRLLGGNMYCKQHVMPPHDIVASLYEYPDTFFPLLTGEPGRIDHYWTENMDLYRALNMPDLEAWLPKNCYVLIDLCFIVILCYDICLGICLCLWGCLP